MTRDELYEAAQKAAVTAWREGHIFASMAPGQPYVHPPHDVVMARLSRAIIDAVEPGILAVEHARLRGEIIALLRASGVRHRPPDTFPEVDQGYDLGLDSVLGLLDRGYGDG